MQKYRVVKDLNKHPEKSKIVLVDRRAMIDIRAT
jgi:hypothetical protein